MSAMNATVYQPSFAKMLVWSKYFLLWSLGIGLACCLSMSVLFFLLSRLPWTLFMAPLMLGIMPVVLVFVIFLPILLIGALLISRFFRYQLDEVGMTQSFGTPSFSPIQKQIAWPQFREVRIRQVFRLQLLQVDFVGSSLPMSVYLGFLPDPNAFLAHLQAHVPDHCHFTGGEA